METIIGTGANYAVQIDDLNNVQNVIPIPLGSLVTSNHDALNAKKMQDLSETGVISELAKPTYTLKIKPLPDYGEQCIEKEFYAYNGKIVICRQTHNRTEHTIETIPNLFTFFRVDTGSLEWIANELIRVDWERIYLTVRYKCIQAHMTVQTPNLTPALWNVVVTTPAWTVGVLYRVDNRVTYLGKNYKCLQQHTAIQSWNPVSTLNVLWKLI